MNSPHDAGAISSSDRSLKCASTGFSRIPFRDLRKYFYHVAKLAFGIRSRLTTW